MVLIISKKVILQCYVSVSLLFRTICGKRYTEVGLLQYIHWCNVSNCSTRAQVSVLHWCTTTGVLHAYTVQAVRLSLLKLNSHVAMSVPDNGALYTRVQKQLLYSHGSTSETTFQGQRYYRNSNINVTKTT